MRAIERDTGRPDVAELVGQAAPAIRQNLGAKMLIPPDPTVLRDDHFGMAAQAAAAAFEAMPELLDVQVATDFPRQLARIDMAGVAAPSAKEPQQPFCPHGVAKIRDRAERSCRPGSPCYS